MSVFLIVPLVGSLQLSISFPLGHDGVSLGILSQIIHIFKQTYLLRPSSWKFLPVKFKQHLCLQASGNQLPKGVASKSRRTVTSTRGLRNLKRDYFLFFLTDSSISCIGRIPSHGLFFLSLCQSLSGY